MCVCVGVLRLLFRVFCGPLGAADILHTLMHPGGGIWTEKALTCEPDDVNTINNYATFLKDAYHDYPHVRHPLCLCRIVSLRFSLCLIFSL